MKRTICAVLVMLFVMTTLPGCQKTPESPIVVGKDTDVLIDKAQTEESQSQAGSFVDVD